MTATNDFQHLFNAPSSHWRRMIIEGMVRLLQTAVPDQFLSFYLIGSSTDEAATPISDIDAIVFLREGVGETAVQHVNDLLANLRHISPLRLDVKATTPEDPRWASDPRVKLSGQLVTGEDILDRLPLPTKEAYQAWIRPWPLNFIRIMHDGNMAYPLAYPDPDDEFFGYTRIRATVWYPAGVVAGTKELVAAVGWIATAVIAQETGTIITTRSQAVKQYQTEIGGEWADYIARVYERCGQQWRYAIPKSLNELRELQSICSQFRDFVNFYLAAYTKPPQSN